MIVPSLGPAARLGRLLDSLEGEPTEHETIVIDNGSPGGEVAELCRRYGGVRVIRLPANRGYSVPVNLAASQAGGEALVLLNDDCVCEPGFVAAIVAQLAPREGVVMAAGALRSSADPSTIDTAGMQLDRTLLVYDYLNGESLRSLAEAADPIGPSAAAAAFDAAAFAEAGGFDERLFAYWEDVDLVLRLILAGGSCRLARAALGIHEHSATLGPGSVAKNRLMGYGRGYLLRKWSVLSARRLAPVLAREIPLLAGQALIDRNLAGFAGRYRGWVAAADQRRPYPSFVAGLGGGDPLPRTLRRRLSRRMRLSAAARSRRAT